MTDPLAQNADLGRGQCRLLKALSHIKPHFPSAKKVLDTVASLANSEVHPIVLLEYTPFKKIQSIPNGTCAFERSDFNHGITLMTWKNDTPENLVLARSIGRELANIVAIGQREYLGQVEQGYGNYGTLVYIFRIQRLPYLIFSDLDHGPEEEDGVVVKDKAEALFGKNYPRLQELKKKYDPENIFNKWFAITPCA